jgi:dCMP deaminase
MNKWDKRFIELANLIATWSKDSTQVGCVLIGPNREIISTGYNGFPSKVRELQERKERPNKYFYTSHAEENALILAARRGSTVEDCSLYLSDNLFPCANCTRLIVTFGIKTIYCSELTNTKLQGDWKDNLEASWNMLRESNVKIVYR